MDFSLHPAVRKFHGAVLAIALAYSAAGAPALAGQASTSFHVTIHYVPASTSCTASAGTSAPVVQCGPAAPAPVVTPTPGAAATPGTAPAALPGTPPAILASGGSGARNGQDLLHGFRLPDTRVKVAGALVDVGEESFYAWGEYSSRIVVAGGIEYVEMTVTW